MAGSDGALIRGREGEPPERVESFGLGPDAFREGFGEELTRTLDLATWHPGWNLGTEYERIETEVREAVEREDGFQRRVRQEIHPRLAWGEGAPKCAGRYEVTVDEIAQVHRGLLFNGGVEACDGNKHVYDTLPLTIYQIGVALVSYGDNQGTWCQRLFRRDLHLDHGDLIASTLDQLERRSQRGGLNQPQPGDMLSELGERAIMSYAERAVLLDRSEAVWRMGHGSPAPLELLNGAGCPDLVIESIKVMRGLIEGHRKFVFVASEPGDLGLLTIGQGLHPLEFAIVCTLRDRLEYALSQMSFSDRVSVDATWDGETLTTEQWVQRFRDEIAPHVVVGVYRATRLAPAQLFYAHEDHFDVAARIALADSVLQEERGFPLLIELADRVCRDVYGGSTLKEMASAAYAAAGVPFRYQSERATRSR